MTKIVWSVYIVSAMFLQFLFSTSSQSMTHHKKKIRNKCPIGFEWNEIEQECEHKFKQFCENIVSGRDQDPISIELFDGIAMQFLYEWQFKSRIINCNEVTNDLLSAKVVDVFAENVKDLSILNGLKNIEVLSIVGLTKLKSLNFLYSLNNLVSLNIIKTNGKVDFSPIGKQKKYIALVIVDTRNIQSFDFIDAIDEIKYLNLNGTNFNDIDKVVGKRIERLSLFQTPLKSIEAFANAPYINEVCLNDKIYNLNLLP